MSQEHAGSTENSVLLQSDPADNTNQDFIVHYSCGKADAISSVCLVQAPVGNQQLNWIGVS